MSAGDLMFGSIAIWGSERPAYMHRTSSRFHKKHIKYVAVSDLLFGSIVVWGSERPAYMH